MIRCIQNSKKTIKILNLSNVLNKSSSYCMISPLATDIISIRKTGCIRFLSTKNSQSTETSESKETASALVLTPYQKVAATAKTSVNLGILALGVTCAYFIIRELLPSRLNPNSLFNEAVDQIKNDVEITSRLGVPIRGYGRDHGGHREGRRNFIENVELKDKNGNPRLRIKFNIKGPYGHAYVFAEARKGMKKGEWIYLIVQCTNTGEMVTIQDNRHLLHADSQEEQDAYRQLLSGGTGSSGYTNT